MDRSSICALLCLVAACGKSSPPPSAPTATTPNAPGAAPDVAVPDTSPAVVESDATEPDDEPRSATAVVLDYWGHFGSGALGSIETLFAATAESELVDWGLPLMTGPKAIVAGTAGRWTSAFPVMAADVRIVVDDGDRTAVAVVELSGNQRAVFRGPGRDVQPVESAKGAFVRLLILHIIELDDAGLIARERFHIDVASLYQQKGISGGGGREAEPRQVLPEVRVRAAHNDIEIANVATVRRIYDALNRHDVTCLDLLDDAFVEAQQYGFGLYTPALSVDKAAFRAGLTQPAVPGQPQFTLDGAFGATDWVVTFGRLRGGDETTKIDLRVAEVMRVVGGKLIRSYSFADGLRFAIQAGQFADFAAEEQARLAAPPEPPKPPKPVPPPEPTPEACAQRYQPARVAMQGEDTAAALTALEAVLAEDRTSCRKTATAILAESFFDGVRKDKRLSRLATEIAVDPKRSLAVQLCADPSRVAALIDPKRGVSTYVETEAGYETPATLTQGTQKGAAASLGMAALFGDLWCFVTGEGEGDQVPGEWDHMSDLRVDEPVLADVKEPTLCLHRDQQSEYASQGDICLVNTDVGWRIAAWTLYPTGPIDPAEYRARAAKRIKVGFKAFGH